MIGDAIHRALHQTLERIAAENGCREVVIETWKGCDNVATVPRSCLNGQAGRVLTLDSTIAPTGALH